MKRAYPIQKAKTPTYRSRAFNAEVVWKDNKKALKIVNDYYWQDTLNKFATGDKIHVLLTEKKPKRTIDQNSALHLWYELVARELNDAGYTVQMVLKQKVDLDFDKDKVKELLWRPAQEAILKKRSTTELKKTEDIDKVFDHLNRHLGEKFGIHVPFPYDPNKID